MCGFSGIQQLLRSHLVALVGVFGNRIVSLGLWPPCLPESYPMLLLFMGQFEGQV
jgi:hypothetical protein